MRAVISKDISLTNERGAVVSFAASNEDAPFAELSGPVFAKLQKMGIAAPYCGAAAASDGSADNQPAGPLPDAEPVGPAFNRKRRRRT